MTGLQGLKVGSRETNKMKWESERDDAGWNRFMAQRWRKGRSQGGLLGFFFEQLVDNGGIY